MAGFDARTQCAERGIARAAFPVLRAPAANGRGLRESDPTFVGSTERAMAGCDVWSQRAECVARPRSR